MAVDQPRKLVEGNSPGVEDPRSQSEDGVEGIGIVARGGDPSTSVRQSDLDRGCTRVDEEERPGIGRLYGIQRGDRGRLKPLLSRCNPGERLDVSPDLALYPPFLHDDSMANLKASKKDIRKIARRTDRNRRQRNRLKTLRKRVDAALEGDDKDAAQAAVRSYMSAIDKAAKTGVVHRNKANRHKATITARLAG